jgi:hypothetical protein
LGLWSRETARSERAPPCGIGSRTWDWPTGERRTRGCPSPTRRVLVSRPMRMEHAPLRLRRRNGPMSRPDRRLEEREHEARTSPSRCRRTQPAAAITSLSSAGRRRAALEAPAACSPAPPDVGADLWSGSSDRGVDRSLLGLRESPQGTNEPDPKAARIGASISRSIARGSRA